MSDPMGEARSVADIQRVALAETSDRFDVVVPFDKIPN